MKGYVLVVGGRISKRHVYDGMAGLLNSLKLRILLQVEFKLLKYIECELKMYLSREELNYLRCKLLINTEHLNCVLPVFFAFFSKFFQKR